MQRSVNGVDGQLIRGLQDNPRASYAELARLTGSSESTVKRRVERLIERGVVRPATHVDLDQLGIEVRAMVGLRVSLGELRSAARRLCELPDVTFVALTAGRFDVIAFVAKPTLAELSHFMTDEISKIDGILGSESLVATEVWKLFSDWRMPLTAIGEDGSNKVTER